MTMPNPIIVAVTEGLTRLEQLDELVTCCQKKLRAALTQMEEAHQLLCAEKNDLRSWAVDLVDWDQLKQALTRPPM